MKKVRTNQRRPSLKFMAAIIVSMLAVSTIAMIRVTTDIGSGKELEPIPVDQVYASHPCEISSVLAQEGVWVSPDSSLAGTPSQAHTTVSDTSGTTIVADFHGFYRNNTFSINGTLYDNLEMPGAFSMNEPGRPMLPRLSEFVEIPFDVDVSVQVLASSYVTDTGYNVRPAPLPNVPVELSVPDSYNLSLFYPAPTIFDPVYSRNAFFPGNGTSVSGETTATSIVIRGHRLLELNFYPVQFNPVTGNALMFSQLVIKLKYSKPAQIQPVRSSLRSDIFEQIIRDSILYYDPIHIQHSETLGEPFLYSITPPSPPSSPNSTVHMFSQSQLIPEDVSGEYLIITTDLLKPQALKLAAWKQQKGVRSAVYSFSEPPTTTDVRAVIEFAYNNAIPAPTYVLLFGDVEIIPTNYDMNHRAKFGPGFPPPLFQPNTDGFGTIASDLGYFNIEGHRYFPDMIYSRISVDTPEQAEIVVNKTLQYEQSPPFQPEFYSNMLSTGYFNDMKPRNGIEDREYPFVYYLEKIREFLESDYAYKVNYTYTRSDAQIPVKFYTRFDPTDPDSNLLSNSPLADYYWPEEEVNPILAAPVIERLQSVFNQGSFFALYYGHGSSTNMVYNFDANPREGIEGWVTPYFDTSCVRDLVNGNKTPLIVSMGCNTGWFDGETDQTYMDISGLVPNPFSSVASECFAENITRMKDGGAIAVIAASRPAYARISGDLLNGIVQAFWPGFQESENQPIYEMGAALLFSKLQVAHARMTRYDPEAQTRTTFEEFHLFGDPETQLWTENPSNFSVEYQPIGTTGDQKFAVTVKNKDTGDRVPGAKVCIQQGTYIYQVGYTDNWGQIRFNCDPFDTLSSLNVTVTKHNFRPYIGEVETFAPDYISPTGEPPTVSASPESVVVGRDVKIIVSGFDEQQEVNIFFDGVEQYPPIPVGSNEVQIPVPDDEPPIVTVTAKQGNTRASNYFKRLSTDQNPDSYIYSQYDESTWHLANYELVWDNPCITIYKGSRQVTYVKQNENYDVKVKVYCGGNADAVDTKVSLRCSYNGGVSWRPVGNDTITIALGESNEASISWMPNLPNAAYLQVVLEPTNERLEDESNNIGLEYQDVIPLCSPGSRNFQVGNPTDAKDYVLINVKQEGSYDDVWNATVLNYSSQRMEANENKSVTLFVDPGILENSQEERNFTVDIYINGRLVGGATMEATANAAECHHVCYCICVLILLVGIIAIGVLLWYARRP
ncbi:MAG: hypothetical protein EAX87_00610 [Candidatus Thorarchaeota archaeon]|nr:hypothetical protein [Candidatus Thorarchaeota archaeon]